MTPSGLVVNVSYNAWGWLHFGMGVIAFVVGIGVLAGRSVARAAAVVLAGASALIHLAFIAAFPVWSLVIIALDVIVIYAILVHGRETERA